MQCKEIHSEYQQYGKSEWTLASEKWGLRLGFFAAESKGHGMGGGGIIEAVTERYCNPVSLRFDPENLDHTGSLQDEEKWAQTTTEKNTLSRSPFVVAYTTSSRQNKGPLYRLVVSAHCRATHNHSSRRICLHFNQWYEHYVSVTESSNPQTLSVQCGQKENRCSASVDIVQHNSVHHVQRQPLSFGVQAHV